MKLTKPDTPAAFRAGRYCVIPPRPLDRPIDYVRVPTPLPGKPERLTLKPPSK